MIKTIKFSEIKAIKPIIASADENISQVKERAKCDIIFNGGIYTFADRSIDSPFKLDGQLYGKYNTYGFAIDNANKNIYFAHSYTDTCSEFIGEYGVLINKNMVVDTIGLGDKRERTAIGITPNNELVIACLTGSDKCSTKATAQLLKDKGCSFAINLDGGGSTQYILEDGTKYLSGRNVVWYVGIWLEKDNEEDKEEDNKVSKKNILLIAGHGAGDPGAVCNDYQEANLTREVVNGLVKSMANIANINTYPTTQNAYKDYQNGKLNATANFSQYDYVLEIHFNASVKTSTDGNTMGVECFVKSNESGISVEEAICKNISACGLKNRGVKRRDNLAVMNTAKKAGVSAALLEVCFIDDADDMKVYEAKKAEIIKGIANGIKSGFGLSGEILEPFGETTPSVPSTPIDTPADWAKEAWEKAATKVGIDGKSIMDGTRPTDTITRQEIAVILNRLGLLD